MSIMNFLPWRQQRRARCLRFWGAMCVGTVLLMFAIIFCLRINCYEAARAANGADGNADRAARACLPGETRLTGAEASADPSTTRMATGAGIPFPRHSFTGLADRASLSASCSDVERVCHNPAGLSALRDALGQIAGFTPGTAGELRQDSQGRWMFTLHLKSEG